MSDLNKVIFILIDGLRADTAQREMGFLESTVDHQTARRWTLKCALPSLSRPLYHTVHTGTPPQDHGVTSNDHVRESQQDNVFSLTRDAGGKTAAAAYSWFAELYNGLPFDPIMDREVDDPDKMIQHGRFYIEDDHPDAEIFRDADMLIKRHDPDYILVHPMACDHMGHEHGGDSVTYNHTAAKTDNFLSNYVPGWMERGYTVFVSADHGMDAGGNHGGTKPEVIHVPFYHLGSENPGVEDTVGSQLSVAPTLLTALGLNPGTRMRAPSLI